MKKRIISIMLILCMVLAFMPQAAVAAESDWENEIWIGNTPVNKSTNMTDNSWVFFPGYNILVLNDNFFKATATNLSGSKDKAVIRVGSIDNLTIQLLGNATVGVPSIEYLPPEAADGISTYGIYAPNTSLAIEGTGTLNVSSNANAIWCKDLRVEGPTLNCNSYRTAIRVIDSSAAIDKAATRGNMLVKSGATVTAKTTGGSGIYPETFVLGGYGADYRDNGGAAILVSGSLTVENSTVNAENTCNKLPTVTSGFKGINGIADKTDVFYGNSFCTSIFVWQDLTVSGSDASVTGKLKNTTNGYINDTKRYIFKFGAVVADKMNVKEGGTLEGFITTTYHSEFAQGLRRFCRNINDDLILNNALISRSGEGTVRTGIVNTDVAVEAPEYADSPYYVTENFSPTEQYANHLEITIGKVSTVYLRTTDSGPEWSFQSDFGRAYSLDSATIDFRDFPNSVFVQNGWSLDWGTPEIYVQSGDWTLLPATDREINCSLEKGSLTVQCENGQTYEGGSANIASGATLNIQGDGISKKWEIFPLNDSDIFAGSVRFISGTVRYASAKFINKIYILGGNINFDALPGQVVKNGDGATVYPHRYYFENPDSDKVISISSPEGTIVCEDEYYYTIDYSIHSESAMIVWSVNDFDIYYATAETADGEQYRLLRVSGGNGKLQKSVPFYGLDTNPNYRFYRTPDESVTLNAGKINVYENWITIDDPHLIDTLTELGSNMSAEWSYQNEKGEKVVVGGSSLSCTIDDLSEITNYRTYTCKVYLEDANGKKEEIGSYSANVYVMRWEQPETIYSAPGKEVTFAINPSAETEWAANYFSNNNKWQVNKGTGWEDIPNSNTDSYTVTITEENAGYRYRRVINDYIIGNFDKHESSIYIEFTSPELSVTLVPEITSQPQSIKIQENDTTMHEICVSANNAESYLWQKKVDGTFVDIEGETSSTLEVGVGDVGTYRCVVSNRFGETVSEEASVGKGLTPSCGTLSGVKVTLGAKAQFNVGISNAPGDGSVSVKWQYSADDGATWVDVVSPDDSENISMNVLEMVFSQIWSDGTVIKRYEIISSSMTINKTTADMDGWKVRCVLTDAVGVYYSNTVELGIEMPDYTVTFDTDGGTEIASKTTVQWTDTVLDGVSDPTKDGWKFVGWKYGDVTVTSQTTYKDLAADADVTSIELKAQWEDITAPTGEISIGENSWKAFLNKITFGLFFKDTQTVTITASDNSGEAVTVSYLLSDEALTENELSAKEFITYTGGFDIEPNNEWIIYAKLTDKAGNVRYLSSDGIVLDNVAPVISGIENGKTYCEAQTVTVDEKYTDSVTVNGTEVSLDENNQFTLNPAGGTQTIVATDKAGNVSAEITVTVNDGHTAGDDDGDCSTPVYCIYHPDTVVVAAKSHDFSGQWHNDENGHWHVCQNEGCTVAETEAPHSGTDDGDCTTAVICECGYTITAAKSHDFSGQWHNDENGHWHTCQNDGCTVAETETPHSGTDDGDCTTAVICECGYTITAAKSHDFSGQWHNDENGHWHTCQNDGCTVAETEAPHSGTDDGDCTTAVICECGYTVTAANAEHTCEWQSGNGKYWQKCKYCDFETAKKDIPTVTINGADAVCITQDYKFGIILPEGATDALYGYDFGFMGTSGLEPTAEDGKLYGAVSAVSYDLGAKSFKVTVTAKTAEGFAISASKTVVLMSEHTDAEPKDHICDICGVKFSDHTGGEATCTDKAVCDYCGKEYGEPDSSNHDLEKIPAKDATAAETGNKEHWHCLDCDKLFADENGEREIELEDTEIAKLPPEITDGKGQTVSAEDQEDLTFSSDADIDDFIRVELDGKILDEKDYTVGEDGTVVTLKADFIATLSAGKHTIGIVSESGTATATFTVKAKATADNGANTPQTGDNSHTALWITLLFASFGALAVTAVAIKKRKREN